MVIQYRSVFMSYKFLRRALTIPFDYGQFKLLATMDTQQAWWFRNKMLEKFAVEVSLIFFWFWGTFNLLCLLNSLLFSEHHTHHTIKTQQLCSSYRPGFPITYFFSIMTHQNISDSTAAHRHSMLTIRVRLTYFTAPKEDNLTKKRSTSN